jgi:cyclic-di-GMP phosphodiesterase TipF (flagellum assembly factor)
MPNITNWLVTLSYAVLTAALGIMSYKVFGLGVDIAIGTGVLSFLLAAQTHQTFNRSQERKAFENELTFLQNGKLALSEEIEILRGQSEDMVTGFEEKVQDRNHQVISEVRLLETLIRQMASELEKKARKAAMEVVEEAQVGVMTGNDPQAVKRLIESIEHALSKAEENGDMAPGDRAAMFDSMNERELLDTIRSSLEQNRVDLYLQPIVTLPQRQVCFYEALSRLRSENGTLILPSQYLRVAEPAGLMSIIDNLLLFRCVQMVRRLAEHKTKISIMCNISLNSLQDKSFFPYFLDFMSFNSDLADTLVFEFARETIEKCGPDESKNLSRLAELGFQFSLDRIGDLDLDLPDLRQRNFRYIKVASNLFLHGSGHANGAFVHPSDLKELLGRFGIDLIVERLEHESQVVEVLEYEAQFGQGYLFGEPRPIEEVEAAIGAQGNRDYDRGPKWKPIAYHGPEEDEQAAGF